MKSRPYRMVQRAEQVDHTRQRIVEATMRLHEEIGLSATTVSAVAAAAGVTRLTVYRHFPEEGELFAACSEHWRASQSMPDPSAWAAVTDPAARVAVGLTDLYRHYRDGRAMLPNVHRDLDVLPEEIRRQIEAAERGYRSVLLEGFPRAGRSRHLKAALGHATSFWTWYSLCETQGLSNPAAVKLMTELVLLAARPPQAGGSGR